MRIKNASVVESKLDEENGEIVAKVVVLLEVEDDSHTSYVTEIPLTSLPINTWDVLDVKEKNKQIVNSLKGRSY